MSNERQRKRGLQSLLDGETPLRMWLKNPIVTRPGWRAERGDIDRWRDGPVGFWHKEGYLCLIQW